MTKAIDESISYEEELENPFLMQRQGCRRHQYDSQYHAREAKPYCVVQGVGPYRCEGILLARKR